VPQLPGLAVELIEQPFPADDDGELARLKAGLGAREVGRDEAESVLFGAASPVVQAAQTNRTATGMISDLNMIPPLCT